ncbi:hypothetical protein PGRAN_12519 [Listeria grandensis FSL F6-0971]|uniref:Uncharacterized protein n=1 Tax=Listeria grandensis FSL F6-0971 TaxID=1265819 RepID=W7BH74_9LIST|nr:hypothetical protein PGRAN_12519 [Listeria grandensis FSL F6-0971]
MNNDPLLMYYFIIAFFMSKIKPKLSFLTAMLQKDFFTITFIIFNAEKDLVLMPDPFLCVY